MSEVTAIGLDIANNALPAHGADASGERCESARSAAPSCWNFLASEACGRAHHWSGELTHLGLNLKPMPPAYVKPFLKRYKNDAVDAEAICEAAQRPDMRFVAIKNEEQQDLLCWTS